MNNKFFKDLSLIQNDVDQSEAYQSSINTVVIAGPGSGKTRVLTLKAIKLCRTEIQPPSGLACISYSRETVRELKKRLFEYDYKKNSRDFIGTMHGFCIIHIIEPFAHLYPEYKIPIPLKIASNKVIDETFQSVLHKLNITDHSISKTDLDKKRSLSIPGSSSVQLEMFDLPGQAEIVYNDILREKGVLDFMNIINIATKMIREQEYVKKTLEAKFSWLLIDEYQDLGKALHEMVLELQNQTSIRIFAVGDMNQSIYGFTGAYPDFLRELNNLPNFESIILKSNYRSNQQIINSSLDSLQLPPPGVSYLAKHRLNENAEFTFITCRSEMEEQYQVVANKIIPKLKEKGIKLNEVGILVGSGSQVSGMANTLKLSNIPFYIAKWSFANSDVIQWLQDCAQWCIDSNKHSFQDIFNFWCKLLKLHDEAKLLKDPIVIRSEFYEILDKSRSYNDLKNWLSYLIESLSLIDLMNDSDRYPEEVKNIGYLLNEINVGNLINSELKRFANLGIPDNEVTITTRHSSKGLEFEVVILLGMEEGRFPDYRVQDGSKEMEEVHRLCYVCISRAKRECILIRSKEHTIPTRKGDWTKSFEPSRFWNILTDKFGTNSNIVDSEEY